MITALNPTFTTENLEWRQQLSEQKPEVVNRFTEEIIESQNEDPKPQEIGSKNGVKVQGLSDKNSKDEQVFSDCWKIMEKIVRCAESVFNAIYKLGYVSLMSSFEFLTCSIKFLTDCALVNLIKELNIIRQFRIQIGTFFSPAQQPNTVNKYYILNHGVHHYHFFPSNVQKSNCKDEDINPFNIFHQSNMRSSILSH
jgi:hypothetical protein